MVKETREIKMEQYTQIVLSSKANDDVVEDAVGQIAIESGWHPCGYGCMRPRVYEENGKYFAEWYRSNTCD